MRNAVVCYSLSGHSRRIANHLANALNCPLIELEASRYKPGFVGFVRAGFDSLSQKRDLAKQRFSTLQEFDRIAVCGPVWTSYPSVPIRGLLSGKIGLPEFIGLFLTHGNIRDTQKAFQIAESDLGRPLTATAHLANRDEGTPAELREITGFVAKLSSRPVIKIASSQ